MLSCGIPNWSTSFRPFIPSIPSILFLSFFSSLSSLSFLIIFTNRAHYIFPAQLHLTYPLASYNPFTPPHVSRMELSCHSLTARSPEEGRRHDVQSQTL